MFGRRFVKVCVSLCIVILFQFSAVYAAEKFILTVLHTNDLHGMLEPFDYDDQKDFEADDAGGLARRATLLKNLRAGAGESCVVVDTGDFFVRGPWFTKLLGAPEIAAFNYMKYDMLSIGNNEFKGRPKDAKEIFARLLNASSFPWICANVTVGDTGVPVEGLHPYIIKTFKGVRVGFFGITSTEAAEYKEVQGWKIEDPIAAAKRIVPLARKECDILIAVTHIGDKMDEKLVKEVDGIDAVVGGHSHTFITSPRYATSPSGVKVPIVQAGELGIMVGELTLTFEKNTSWKLVSSAGRLIPVDEKIQPDAEMEAIIQGYIKSIKKKQ
jgi:2',3'-cyclic-nucleotide 2'-phosphodiesterase (5'-nucleotidase family)